MSDLPEGNKAYELVKEFVEKIALPAAEELGLLMGDRVRLWRFKNQIKILMKAKDSVEKHGISIKSIPLKILVPLLDNASLEEDEQLQDLWANMLTNMIDSQSNFQNHIFPYILGQISTEDLNALRLVSIREEELCAMKRELSELRETEMTSFISSTTNEKTNYHNPSREFKNLQEKIKLIEQSGFYVLSLACDNLERLKLIRQLPPKIIIPEFQTGGESTHALYGSLSPQWHQIDAVYDIDEYGYRLTDLGELFLKACKPKNEGKTI